MLNSTKRRPKTRLSKMLLGIPPLDSIYSSPTLLSFSDVLEIVNTLSDGCLQVSVIRDTPGNHEMHLKHHAKDLFRRSLCSQELKHNSLFKEVYNAVNESLRNQKSWSEAACIKCCCLHTVWFSLSYLCIYFNWSYRASVTEITINATDIHSSVALKSR